VRRKQSLDFIFDALRGVLYDISQFLNTHLDRNQLATCVAMIENGVNPEALAVCTFC
jgi:mitotic-spindle organizing protein 1